MRPDVAHDFEFGRRYLGHMKQIIGLHLIGEAPPDEDMGHNTDLIVLRLDAVRIACRVRREAYQDRYADEFTIRSGRPNGTHTELAKVIEGWGDYILYGFGSASENRLTGWTLGDLRVFRLWFGRHLMEHRGAAPGIGKTNPDGTTFRAFRYADLPREFVCATHNPTARAA